VRKLFEEAKEYAEPILFRESGKISDKSHNWRNIPITLIDLEKGEQTAQAGVKAVFDSCESSAGNRFFSGAGRLCRAFLIFSVERVV
jgi:hypothetical protein